MKYRLFILFSFSIFTYFSVLGETTEKLKDDIIVCSVVPGESIQAAIDSASNKGGGVVVIGKGMHVVTTPIKVKSNITLRGEGQWDSKISTTENIKVIIEDAGGIKNVTIENLEVSGTNALNGGGIQIISMTTDNENITLTNVHVLKTGWGVHIKGCKNLKVSDCLFEENGTASKEKFAHNMYLRRCYGALVRNSKFLNSTSANGINISYSENIEIYNCEMSGNYFRGVRAAVTDGFLVHNCMITNNGNVGLLANAEKGQVTQNIDWQNNCIANNNSGVLALKGATGICKNNNSYGNKESDYSLPDSVTQDGNVSIPDSHCKIKTSGVLKKRN
jgi:polygalacturonase